MQRGHCSNLEIERWITNTMGFLGRGSPKCVLCLSVVLKTGIAKDVIWAGIQDRANTEVMVGGTFVR